jgi:HlyD family secretion protein
MDAALEIRSPIDGVVLTRERQSESVIEAGSAILEVGDPNELEIVVEYLSSDAVKMRPGARAFIEGWGGERPLDARIRRIHPSGFTKTSALGVEEQRVRVILDLVSPASEHGRIGDGFRVDVRVVLAQCDDSIRVPIGSLFRVGEQWAVFVLDGGRARKRLVEVGARTMDVAEVLTGIDVGEQVIVYPSNDVSDGTRVVLRSRSL